MKMINSRKCNKLWALCKWVWKSVMLDLKKNVFAHWIYPIMWKLIVDVLTMENKTRMPNK